MKSIKAKNITKSSVIGCSWKFDDESNFQLVLDYHRFNDTSADYCILTSEGQIEIIWIPDYQTVWTYNNDKT